MNHSLSRYVETKSFSFMLWQRCPRALVGLRHKLLLDNMWWKEKTHHARVTHLIRVVNVAAWCAAAVVQVHMNQHIAITTNQSTRQVDWFRFFYLFITFKMFLFSQSWHTKYYWSICLNAAMCTENDKGSNLFWCNGKGKWFQKSLSQ